MKDKVVNKININHEPIDIYHGSEVIVEKPTFGKGKKTNDYGLGFYCTKDLELAKEWAVLENRNGFANHYTLDLNGLEILDLSSPVYSVLHWITLLLQNRTFNLKTDVAKQGKEYLIENFNLDVSKYDIITGYRADDSYFAYAQSFLNNQISMQKLSQAMELGNLGKQIVLISKNSFKHISFVDFVETDSKDYWPKRNSRNEVARSSYLKLLSDKIEKDDVFLADIIRG